MTFARRSLFSRRTLVIALWLGTAALFLLAESRTLRRTWWPVFDDASIWLRTWDVGGRHTPLIGPHSRFGWHHPGPMMYYVLAPLLRVSGGMPSMLQAQALLIGFASALGIAVLTALRVGASAALVLAIATGLLGFGYGDRLIEPWNPYLVVLPFALFMVAIWLVACGDVVAEPIAALAGTFAGQAHLGAIPPVLLLAAAALLLGRLLPIPAPRGGARKWRLFAIGSLVAFWLPPLLEQLTASEGNLARIGRFVLEPPEPIVGFRKGVLMSAAQLLPWGPWLGNETASLLGHLRLGAPWELFASALPLAIAIVLAVRFRDALGLRLAVIAAIGFLACVAATAQIRGIPAEYLTLWSRPVAMVSVAAPCVVLARRYTPFEGRAGAMTLAAATALVTAPIAIRALHAGFANPALSKAYELINPLAVAAVPPGGEVRVGGAGIPFAASPQAIMVALERAGRIGKTLPPYAQDVGEHRIVGDDSGLPTLLLMMGGDCERPRDRAHALRIGGHDPLTPAQRAEANQLRDRLEQALRDIGREDLVAPLLNGETWLGPIAPASLNRVELDRYLELAAGDDKVPWALFVLRPASL